MKRIAKKLLLLTMAVALTASLTSCSLFEDNMIKDCQVYIQGTLDQLYKGQYNEDFLTMLDFTEEEAKAEYESWLSQEVDYFCNYFSVEFPTDEYKTRVGDLYKEIYALAKYTVNPTTKLESGAYAVEVSVEPINIMQLVTSDDMQAAYTAIEDAAIAENDVANMSDADLDALYEKMDGQYGEAIIELVRAQLPNLGYEPAKSMVFQLKEVADNTFDLVEGDLQMFDGYVIAY